MKVDISDIVKNNGACVNIELNEVLEDLITMESDLVFTTPVNFSGQLVNVNGILKLDGQLKVEYTDKCFRCLKDVSNCMDIKVKENFSNAEKAVDDEEYTYQGSSILIDKVLVENIVLNLPMKQLCRKSCKGLCIKCGCDLNENSCECTDQELNPKMEALKNFFENN
jgi:uncharacterized protein